MSLFQRHRLGWQTLGASPVSFAGGLTAVRASSLARRSFCCCGTAKVRSSKRHLGHKATNRMEQGKHIGPYLARECPAKKPQSGNSIDLELISKLPLKIGFVSIFGTKTTADFFWVGLFSELAMFPAGLGLGALFSLNILQNTNWADVAALRDGVLYTLPFSAVFFSLDVLPIQAVRELKRFTEIAVKRIFGKRNALETLLFCAAAGIGEEALFRGAIQGLMDQYVGIIPLSVAVSALAFGVAHSANAAYFALSAMAGAFFASQYELADHNLAAPSVTHCLYDWITILSIKYFSRYSDEPAKNDDQDQVQ
ncbi:hypothetical protein F1559_004559 [Cyanidiococcus yangmingshanensis]|uniref:CAAX prenyl protease 2/Lysostaphin resistance protein A-like domain-containing protein n=1 Tax=Cyanidiococcus yangmingshanensis TaxID=2690220 RepID=A0A7J7IKP3_9RHOD|nr:hypothetical protein F1559_004559 [Cyanidiococcus yangmingshanensis]